MRHFGQRHPAPSQWSPNAAVVPDARAADAPLAMHNPLTIKPPVNTAAVLPADGAVPQSTMPAPAAAPPWPSDMLTPLSGRNPFDDSLTEAAGLARNADALGPYGGSF